jgi:hypothetical protein
VSSGRKTNGCTCVGLFVYERLGQRRGHIPVETDAAESFKRPGVCIKQHFVALGRVGHKPECPAAGQLAVRHFQSSPQAADSPVLAAPIELERFAVTEAERHEAVAVLGITQCLAEFRDTDTCPNNSFRDSRAP